MKSLRSLYALALVPGLVACGAQLPPPQDAHVLRVEPSEARAEAAPPTAAPRADLHAPPSDAREVVFAFVAARGEADAAQSSERIRENLTRAGYRFGSAGHDAQLEVRLEPASGAAEHKLSLIVSSGGKVVDWLAVPLGEAAREVAFVELVNRLSESPRLAGFAEQTARAKQNARREAEAKERLRGPERAQATAAPPTLPEAAIRRCRNARTADACDEITSYLEAHPEGPSAEQARATYALSEKRIARLKGE